MNMRVDNSGESANRVQPVVPAQAVNKDKKTQTDTGASKKKSVQETRLTDNDFLATFEQAEKICDSSGNLQIDMMNGIEELLTGLTQSDALSPAEKQSACGLLLRLRERANTRAQIQSALTE